MKKLFLVLVLTLISRTVNAQLVCSTPTNCTLTVAAVPGTVTVAWDAVANTSTCTLSGYNVYLDNSVAGNTTATQLQISIPTFATHTIFVTALSSSTGCVESAHSNNVTVLLQQSAQTQNLAAPANARISTSSSCASPFGTTAVTITDTACRVWTLNGLQTLVNGVPADSGQGTQYLLQMSGVYVLGTDNNWYVAILASDNVTWSWQLVGPNKPVS